MLHHSVNISRMKSSGMDVIILEIMKYGSEYIFQYLNTLIQNML